MKRKFNSMGALWCGLVVTMAALSALPLCAETARNPIIHADVPDIAMIRVGDTY